MGSAQSIHTTSTENKNLAQQEILDSSVNGLQSSKTYAKQVHSDFEIFHLEDDESSDGEEDEDWNERLVILEDAQRLKVLAEFFLRPEEHILVDCTATARCYFDRPSAPVRATKDDNEERDCILEELRNLKKLAVDYLSPELPAETTDPFAVGRNYFTRSSAHVSSLEDDEEETRILNDMKQLKKLAVDYLQPEIPVRTTDPFACGRNYFTRSSTPVSSLEVDQEETRILNDMKQLKKLAVDYLQPEIPVRTTDPIACARNYFVRPSAPVSSLVEDEEDERTRILEDVIQLKKLAVDYLHPELPIRTTDPFACTRNYFVRPSAETTTGYGLSGEDGILVEQERIQILEEMKQLKKLAVDYLYPELPVQTTDPFACARNYFARLSATTNTYPEDLEEVEEESARVLKDALALKKLAIDYLQPELPIISTDPFACGRNYFNRPSATNVSSEEWEEMERTRVLEDMLQLKKLAVDYLQPELPVQTTTDPSAFARNYFTRPSAPTIFDPEEEEERTCLLKEASKLKALAVDYLHPELPVQYTDTFACSRCYYTRPSAPGLVDQTHTYCEFIDHGFHHLIDHDHHYYWYINNNNTSTTMSSTTTTEQQQRQRDEYQYHFEMDDIVKGKQDDEEAVYEFVETTLEVDPFKGNHPIDFILKDTISMSRSPQSVLMLTWNGGAALSA